MDTVSESIWFVPVGHRPPVLPGSSADERDAMDYRSNFWSLSKAALPFILGMPTDVHIAPEAVYGASEGH